MCQSMGSIKCKGAMMVVVGVLFMLGTTGVLPWLTFGTFWPAFLILGGLHAVACPCMKGGCCKKGEGMMEERKGECCKK